jgi:TRAP transporter TAXI family solute receptor
MLRRSVIRGAAVALCAGRPAFGQSIPMEMTWTAYDKGSSGFDIAVAIGLQFKQAYGSDVRILPSGNDTGRLAPIKAGRAVLSQMGIGTYFAQEGVFEFGSRSWGPQPARLLMSATGCNGLGLAVARDIGVKEIKDIKGRRLAVVVGSPALTRGALALIAFAGLGENDVTLVQFASNNAMWKGIINNEADVALSSTISGQSLEAANSPRGIIWPPMPADDKEGWARVHRKAPYFAPVKATCGSGGLSPRAPVTMAGYAYPIFMTFADRPTDRIEAITKAMIDTYDAYKGSVPGAEGMALSVQNFQWVVPYHDGAIKAFKAKGAWTDAAQKHNDGLVRRQHVLLDAWKAFTVNGPSDDKAFADGWSTARIIALQKAGLDPAFE